MKKVHYAWWILLACCLLNVGVLGIISYSAGIFFQPVVKELGISTASMGMHITVRSLAMATAMPLVGRLLPRKGIQYILATAAAVCFLCFGLMSQFTAIWQWYLAAAVMGIACGFLFFVPTPLLINNWFYQKSGFSLGIALMCSGLSGSIWTPLGNTLIETYGWRAAYCIMAVIGALLVIPAVLIIVKLRPEEKGVLPYGMAEEDCSAFMNPRSTSHSDKKQALGTAIQASGTGMKTFVYVLITCCTLSYCASYVQYLPSFAASIGLGSSVGARIASFAMIGSVVWKLSLGWMNDKLGIKRSTVLGVSSSILAFVILVFFYDSPVMLLSGAFLYGSAPAIMSVSPSLLTKTVFGNPHFGSIYSYITIGTSLVTAAAAAFIGATYDHTGSYTLSFWIGILCCAVSLVMLFISLRQKANHVK